MLESIKQAATRLKREVLTLYYVSQNPRTPLLARVGAILVTAYALSPIDLIPDFIPVLGLLDDIILVPIGVWLVLKFIPTEILAKARANAALLEKKPISIGGLIFMILLWVEPPKGLVFTIFH
jgi:uncharacterized membrane protein YkvA (DUF1232 family)